MLRMQEFPAETLRAGKSRFESGVVALVTRASVLEVAGAFDGLAGCAIFDREQPPRVP